MTTSEPLQPAGPAALTPLKEDAALSLHLQLLGGFELTEGGTAIVLPLAAQRLVAFLALAGPPLERTFVAGKLWFDSSDCRAHACLRSALWRLRQKAVPVVVPSRGQLRLAPQVKTDVDDQVALARRMREPGAIVTDASAAIELLETQLLPGWYDDWLLVERERLRQLSLHGLDALCARLVEQRRYAEAIEAGVAAVRADPLRESAHRAVIAAHLAEGNRAEALRHFHVCCALLHRKLGLEPSAELRALVGAADTARDSLQFVSAA